MKRILSKLLLPPTWVRWSFGLASLLAVGAVLLLNGKGAVSYVAYGASVLGLYYLITVTVVPLIGTLRRLLSRSRLYRRYTSDLAFHDRLTLYRKATINLAYVVIKLVTGLRLHSTWVFSLGVYYLFLSLIEMFLILAERRLRQQPVDFALREWRCYRMTGLFLLTLNVALSGMSVQIIRDGQSPRYAGTLIFFIAAFAFYKIGSAVIGLLKKNRRRTPIFRATQTVYFSCAVVALYSLQTAMFASFSPELDVKIPNIITGSAAAVIITVAAAAMLLNGKRHMKEIAGGA